MAEQYGFGTTEDLLESERLALLASLYDGASHRFIGGARSLDGARVLEVGAGTGGIALWLADQVGPSGHVLATDVVTGEAADQGLIEKSRTPLLLERRSS